MQRSAHTICVVDDHEAKRYAAVKSLQTLGYNTLEAETGEEALAAVDGKLSAMLLDVNLPDVNGVKICQLLRASQHSQLPIVLMTAVYLDDLHKEAGISAGANAYLTSPISRQQLGAIFDRLLDVEDAASQ
jgi:CheY-like chemotaxis protein